jgi:MoxR-like ATPase
MSEWHVFKGSNTPHDGMRAFLERRPPPPWRRFAGEVEAPDELAVDPALARRFASSPFLVDPAEREVINAAILLRRPLLISGNPGTGKTTLAYAIAHELKLGRVLVWPVTSRSTLQEALYRYDAIGRLQEVRGAPQTGGADEDTLAQTIGKYIRLGPVGTALLPRNYPRVLLIDEIDKSDVDLPNDLLHVLEEGSYEIPELMRLPAQYERIPVFPADSDGPVTIGRGRVSCRAFPIVILTSNGEREFPPAFLRRCIRLNIPDPQEKKLGDIVSAYFGPAPEELKAQRDAVIARFLELRSKGRLSTDQLLNAIYVTRQGEFATKEELIAAIDVVLQQITGVTA